MLIQKITFHHFRQFYDTQSITFAGVNSEGLVTVILGENGRGKTGIYRGLLFGLYGDMYLDQDADGKDDIVLTNTKALQEDYDGEKKGVTCTVTIDFLHNQNEFSISRSIFAVQNDKGEKIERLHAAELKNVTNGSVITDKEEIQQFVNEILDERVKNYFFFDGERIERLTRASEQQRKEIAKGIKNLLKIDDLLKSQEVLQALDKQVLKELQKHSSGDYQKKLKEKLENDEAKEKAKLELETTGVQLDEAEQRLEHLTTQLEQFQEEAQKIKELKQQEELLQTKQMEQRAAMQHLVGFNNTLSLLLAKDILHSVKTKLEIVLDYQTEKMDIGLEFIQNLLSDLKCMCGTALQEGSKEYESIMRLEKVAIRNVGKKAFYELLTHVIQLIGFLEDKENDLKYKLDEVSKKEYELETIRQQVESLNKQLSDTGIEDLATLNKERNDVHKQQVQLDVHMKQLRESIEELERKEEQLELALRDLKVKSGVHAKLAKKQEETGKAVKAINQMIKEFEKIIIADLEKVTTNNLQQLLDDSGNMNIQEVRIKKDYSLEVLNSYGHSFLANISQGQRQVLSLSFITALAQVAGGHASLEMPLFMDTPFGRLSSKHELNLLSFLPEVCSQWILLVTDREFGDRERAMFLEKGCWGKYYELRSVEPSVTKIIEHPMFIPQHS
ncbi:AAA family ATPase [Bacillus sp. 41-22]|uniref:AAA family ATPase n=1 Tax=Bacillus sp. 41-22 TaxID=2876713 RepID=UPI0021F15669|nr:AAA family ATPase [Bacillus sp. 41-22]UYO21126.1 AAA family ATPase [Bacillus sp. 41-22]